MGKMYASLIVLLLGIQVTWANFEGDNHPRYIDPNFDYRFSALPLDGELTSDKVPWSSSFWPHIYGGIAFRWNNYYKEEPTFAPLHYRIEETKKEVATYKKELFANDTTPERRREIIQEVNRLKQIIWQTEREKSKHHKKYFFDLQRPYSYEEVSKMSRFDMAKLSPAEKYDIFVGDYNFPLTKHVLQVTRPDDAYWEGICNGWSSAAIEFHEPEAKSVRNKDGIVVDFGSSDIKALLNFYHDAITSNVNTQRYSVVGRVGIRCETAFPKEAWFIGRDGNEYYKEIVNGEIKVYRVPDVCVDMNPGAFHVVMGNQLGLKNESFVAEMVRDNEVWNQPVFKFESKILRTTTSNIRKNATPGTVRQLTMETELFYSNDGGRIFWGTDVPEDEFYAWWEPTNGTSNFRTASKKMKYHLDIDRYGMIIGGMWLSYERPDFVWLKKTKGFIPNGYNHGIVNHLSNLRHLVRLRD